MLKIVEYGAHLDRERVTKPVDVLVCARSTPTCKRCSPVAICQRLAMQLLVENLQWHCYNHASWTAESIASAHTAIFVVAPVSPASKLVVRQ